MANLTERITAIEKRLEVIEQELGITPEPIIKNKKLKEEKPFEPTINGFTKEQLRVMFSWAQGLQLSQLSKSDFEELKKWQMLWDLFPNAPVNYEEINK